MSTEPHILVLQTSFDAIFRVNVRAPFLMIQHALRRMVMVEKEASTSSSKCIVNIASTAGVRASGLIGPYAASKAALISLTQSAALEYASKGIRVNALSPGPLDVPNVKGFTEEVRVSLAA